MFKDNRKNISKEELNFINLCVLNNKVDILIIGGGKGALVKLKGLIKKGVKITLVSKEISEEIKNIRYDRLTLIEDEYKKEYILDKHLIIISISDSKLREDIKKDLDEEFKLYLDSSNFKEGNSVIPMGGEKCGINFSINTKNGNPKGARFLYSKIEHNIEEYGEFINYTTNIRNIIKGREDSREILDFIINDDFKFYFDKGKENLILKLFYKNIFR